ncbi:hypothetical protein [Haladaptatus cibarius]|uniref:hypothetical protein n=1 Tax=Haladaptatus cibarius TaxID=453847 RepID=UPI0006794184|nr:hypothetical protein [Haladaptatus cibarius]
MGYDPAVVFEEHLVNALVGLTTAVIGAFLYETTDGGFLFRKRFQSKEKALGIFLGSLVLMGILTPIADGLWTETVQSVSTTSIVGFTIIASMMMVNRSAGWNQTDDKSMTFYLIGSALILLPHL